MLKQWTGVWIGLTLFSALSVSGLTFFRNPNVGLGIIIGEPTGLSMDFVLSKHNSIAAAAAWSFDGDPSLQAHLDYLFRARDLITIDRTAIPLYFGVGGRVKTSPDERIGVRFPVGMQFALGRSPMEAFFELAPVLDIAPESRLSFNAAVGLRGYFRVG